jgi:hypothetical protein
MIYVALMQCVLIGLLTALLLYVIRSGQEERRELEDRLMAMCHPMALTHVDAVRGDVQGSVNYVDEESYTARGANHADAST